ncbi:peptidase M20 [Ruegeria marisrubri]|uniref:Peptidase M20 n=1 Tax=Ruegeria marisrubri TaxID=1685379 RepID=A0A117KH76_9RHOB|nr:amidohydrolase [Ruegeria marisrubri]KUJ86100.1 peptidase M20 [Ruegeria marisrubri]
MTPETLARLTALRHELHQYPEVSGQEEKTAARIAELLSQYRPEEIVTGIGGHGVAAVFDSGEEGPSVGIRCELDALPIQEVSDAPYVSRVPGKGHLCGHDGHMTIVLGVAEELARQRPTRGRIVLIFQPAEETGKGALAYRADPKFRNVATDYVFSLHNLPGLALGGVELCTGPANCASRGMRVVLKGKTSHAAAPQDGLSPAKAMARLMPALAGLGPGGELDSEYALTTLTHAELGERTFGVAPGFGELWVTLRTVSDGRMARLVADAEALVRQHAEADGLGVEITYDDVFDACTNDPDAVEILAAACRVQGVPLRLSEKPQKFSEDFGQFAKGAKAAMFWLGAGEEHPQLHNPDYDFPDDLIAVGADIFLTAARQLTG